MVKYQPAHFVNTIATVAASLSTSLVRALSFSILSSTATMSGAELPIAVVSFFFQAFAGCIQGQLSCLHMLGLLEPDFFKATSSSPMHAA
jgi:hypothetical protein